MTVTDGEYHLIWKYYIISRVSDQNGISLQNRDIYHSGWKSSIWQHLLEAWCSCMQCFCSVNFQKKSLEVKLITPIHIFDLLRHMLVDGRLKDCATECKLHHCWKIGEMLFVLLNPCQRWVLGFVFYRNVCSSSSAFPAISLRFTLLGEIFAYVTVFDPTIEVVTFGLRGWCMLGVFFVARIHPSRAWMSGSFESIWWNVCMYTE